ncbi:phosphoprotein phosphatase [Rhizoctonia solani AG-1 IA]|uniref:protein-serine/threonine phosphatase n=1 Tax=Thanatephorus cucumeris (strain AG1-IA) TaxID=983506 RepID=L8WQ41_THACA|nr:phosphoprotein phosphatase [Rhizoctonia solani AG-1 IA]
MSSPSSTASDSTPPSPASSATTLAALGDLSLKDPASISDKDKAEAARLKAEGNAEFQSMSGISNNHGLSFTYPQYRKPVCRGSAQILRSAYMRMKIEQHGYAIDDASVCPKAIALDPKYVKAYYRLRRAVCYLAILKPQQAVTDFKKAVQLDPKNANAKTQLDATVKLVRRIEFEKAIEVGEEESSVTRCREIIAQGGCDVDASYTGIKLPTDADGKYTIDQAFMDSMIATFKDGKSIHRRYAWEIVLASWDLLSKEESLVELQLEVGMPQLGIETRQFYDLVHLLSLTGPPSEKHCLVFNGDFVDRGSWSVEVALTLFAYKCESFTQRRRYFSANAMCTSSNHEGIQGSIQIGYF